MNKEQILKKLEETLNNAYSPYSGVKVAAAIEYELDGETHVEFGVNVENVSYGLTVCAERSAISGAVTKGMKSIKSLYVMSNQPTPISPCGACRQVVTEFMSESNNPVLCITQDHTKQWESTIGQLLPNSFNLDEE